MERAKGLDLVHKGVMMHLALSADPDGRFFGTVAGLARGLGLTRGEARWSLSILNKLGFVTLEQPHNSQSTTTSNHLLTVNYSLSTTKEQPHNNHEKFETIGKTQESDAVKKEEKVYKENKEYKESNICTTIRGAKERADEDALYDPSVYFPPPRTNQEVVNAATRQGIPMTMEEAQEFLDYHTGTSWMIGSSPIRKWQMFLRGWHTRWTKRQENKEDGRLQKNGPAHFSGDYSHERNEPEKCL